MPGRVDQRSLAGRDLNRILPCQAAGHPRRSDCRPAGVKPSSRHTSKFTLVMSISSDNRAECRATGGEASILSYLFQ